MNITKNFSFAEFERSEAADKAGITNVITTFEVRDAVVALTREVLQPLRDLYGRPLHINSGYRCQRLNALVGGVVTSQHCKGEAADIATGSEEESYRLAMVALYNAIPFDQMILYPTFVHFSHAPHGRQRGQVLYNKTYKGRRL